MEWEQAKACHGINAACSDLFVYPPQMGIIKYYQINYNV